MISIGGRDVAALVWKHERQRTTDIAPYSMSRTTVRNVTASPTVSLPLQQQRGESDDSDNTDSEEEGYDSDVQHDRNMDYNARFLINPVRIQHENKDVHKPTAGNRRAM